MQSESSSELQRYDIAGSVKEVPSGQLVLYLDFQSTQNNGLQTLCFEIKAGILGTLEVKVCLGP